MSWVSSQGGYPDVLGVLPGGYPDVLGVLPGGYPDVLGILQVGTLMSWVYRNSDYAVLLLCTRTEIQQHMHILACILLALGKFQFLPFRNL